MNYQLKHAVTVIFPWVTGVCMIFAVAAVGYWELLEAIF